MRTIYLRNVPDDVAGRLERLAARAGMSLSAFTVRELSDVARRAENGAVLDGLPGYGVEVPEILEVIAESRSRR